MGRATQNPNEQWAEQPQPRPSHGRQSTAVVKGQQKADREKSRTENRLESHLKSTEEKQEKPNREDQTNQITELV